MFVVDCVLSFVACRLSFVVRVFVCAFALFCFFFSFCSSWSLFGVRCWLLVVGCFMFSCCSLVVGVPCRLLFVHCLLRIHCCSVCVGRWLLFVGCS